MLGSNADIKLIWQLTDICMYFVGSNSHNNNSPAGDGQAGDAGEGNSGKIFICLSLLVNEVTESY